MPRQSDDHVGHPDIESHLATEFPEPNGGWFDWLILSIVIGGPVTGLIYLIVMKASAWL